MKILSAAIASIFLVILPSSYVLAADKAASASATEGINWRKDNDVDAAFALAKASHKPLFLYWGAVWCPPCNQVKATIFNRQDFIDKSRHFVPVYLDGDTPGAQKLAARFKVRGYPTMILLKADGSEI
ncbi:MAG: thioredoxin family protein, partial [bacterium]|nr:thioredoxin family protein [bacterium]